MIKIENTNMMLEQDIETEKPDEINLQMLNEIKNNPECHEFLSAEDSMKELGLS